MQVVQFHPNYAYEDFVEGFRPVLQDNKRSEAQGPDTGAIAFKVKDGVLKDAAAKAADGAPVVLVIDEMNRANLPSVFGELFYLLEYRTKQNEEEGNRVQLPYSSKPFGLPATLFIIGTMNTADRSIGSIDNALRRRFDIFDCPPNTEIIKKYYTSRSGEPEFTNFLVMFMEELNASLKKELDVHHQIGHTYFMGEDFDEKELGRNWKQQILPLIKEFFFDQGDKVDAIVKGLYDKLKGDASFKVFKEWVDPNESEERRDPPGREPVGGGVVEIVEWRMLFKDAH